MTLFITVFSIEKEKKIDFSISPSFNEAMLRDQLL